VSPRSWLAVTAGSVVAADQITKAVALATLEDGRSVPLIDGVLHWTLQRNPGAAFGIFQRAPALFTILAIVISVAIIVASSRVRDRLNSVALGLVLGGALGNLVDRLFRAPGPFRGRVIDFIDFRVWPTFNVADSAVVIGALLLAIASFRSERGRSPAEPSNP
jgi:signal peptidase II